MVFLLLVDNKTSAATRKFHIVFHKSMYILDGVEQCGVYSWTEIKLKVAGSVRLGYSHIGGPQASPYQDAFHNDWQRTLVCTDARCVCIFFNVFDRKRPVACCYRPGSVHRHRRRRVARVSRATASSIDRSRRMHRDPPPRFSVFYPGVIHRTSTCYDAVPAARDRPARGRRRSRDTDDAATACACACARAPRGKLRAPRSDLPAA